MGANILNKLQADKIIASNDAGDRRWATLYSCSKAAVVREILFLLNNIIFSDISESIQKKIDDLHTHETALNYGTLTHLRGQLTKHING